MSNSVKTKVKAVLPVSSEAFMNLFDTYTDDIKGVSNKGVNKRKVVSKMWVCFPHCLHQS
jgi:hypothetical protein